MKKKLAVFASFALFTAVSCGGGGSGDGASSEEGPLEIVRARWSVDGGQPRAIVDGEWMRGLSTPPACALLEGRDGKKSEWPAPEPNTSPDGNTFSKKFAAAETDSELDPLPNYHVRCSVNLSTGRTLEVVAPVSGEVPQG